MESGLLEMALPLHHVVMVSTMRSPVKTAQIESYVPQNQFHLMDEETTWLFKNIDPLTDDGFWYHYSISAAHNPTYLTALCNSSRTLDH